jgi:hypothetical protein
MSIKSKLVPAAAALALIVGVGVAGTRTANAATPQCGRACSNLYSHAFGPAWVLNVHRHIGRPGQPTALAQASRANQGEDFIIDRLGQVRDLFRAGLASGGLTALYGRLFAYEIEYSPHGSFSGLCLGVRTAPGAGTPVVLESCGVTAKTVWIFEPVKTHTGTFFRLISAATSRNFGHPLVLSVRARGLPLITAPLAVHAHQLWRARQGVLPSSPAH